MNVAGETALDVARRLKYSECEELVGGMEEWGRSLEWGEGTKHLRRASVKVRGFLGRVPPVLRPLWVPHPEIPLTCPIPSGSWSRRRQGSCPRKSTWTTTGSPHQSSPMTVRMSWRRRYLWDDGGGGLHIPSEETGGVQTLLGGLLAV